MIVRIIVLLVVLATPSFSYAFGLVGSVTSDNGGGSAATTCTPTLTTGLADGDFVVILIKRGSVTTDPSAVPTGFSQLAKRTVVSSSTYFVYWKIASGESSWQFTWAVGDRTACDAATYRSGFNVTTASDITLSNTAYNTSDSTIRGASFSVPTANSPLIWLGGAHYSASHTIAAPTTGTPTG